MPKRVIDGEGLWGSQKIRRLPPKWRAEYAWLYPIALANGTFEADPRQIWARAYACTREDVTVEHVSEFLDGFELTGLLFCWMHEGKRWGFWTGCERPGRLPKLSRRGRHERVGPTPPAEALADYIARCGSTNGGPTADHGRANGPMGLGFGSGSGLGKGEGTADPKGPPHVAKTGDAGPANDAGVRPAETAGTDSPSSDDETGTPQLVRPTRSLGLNELKGLRTIIVKSAEKATGPIRENFLHQLAEVESRIARVQMRKRRTG